MRDKGNTKITMSIQIDVDEMARMAKAAELAPSGASAADAASVLTPVVRGVAYDWVPAMIEDACHRMLNAQKEGASDD